MRPHRCKRAVALAALLLTCAASVRAQSGGEGLFVLLPVGAGAVGMGESVVARRGGSEQVWWNPAGIIGDSALREIALHHSQTIVGQGNTASFVLPSKRIGTLALSINLLDLGQQAVTTDDSQVQQGTINPLDVAYVVTYAFPFSRYIAVGASLKHVEMRVSCSGYCANASLGGSQSNGGDVGVVVRTPRIPLTLGFAATNLGIGATNYKPGRFNLGANYRIEALDQYTDEVEVYAAANVMTTPGLDSASTGLGADIVLEKRIHVRAGYIVDHANGSGASIGFGFGAGRFTFDLARTFGGLSADTDKPPTYFSLRYLW